MIKKFLVAIMLVAMLVGTASAFVSDEFYPFYGNKDPECFMSLDYTLHEGAAPNVWVIKSSRTLYERKYLRAGGDIWRSVAGSCEEVLPCDAGGTVAPAWLCPVVEQPVVVESVEKIIMEPETFVIYFDFDEDIIRPDQEETLQALVDYVQVFGYASIEFVASCDYRGSDSYNMDLGKRRATATQHWLIENGLDSSTFSVLNNGDRLSPTRILKGIFCPDCWEDRRVEITVE